MVCLCITGSKWGDESKSSCSYCRTCRFDNVCLNLSSHDIQYYHGNGQIPLFYDSSGRPHLEFPPDFVETGQFRKLQFSSWCRETVFELMHIDNSWVGAHACCVQHLYILQLAKRKIVDNDAQAIPQYCPECIGPQPWRLETFLRKRHSLTHPLWPTFRWTILPGTLGTHCLTFSSRCLTPSSLWTSTGQISNFCLQSIK